MHLTFSSVYSYSVREWERTCTLLEILSFESKKIDRTKLILLLSRLSPTGVFLALTWS